MNAAVADAIVAFIEACENTTHHRCRSLRVPPMA